MKKEEIEELNKLTEDGNFYFYILSDVDTLKKLARLELLKGKKEEHDKVQDAIVYLKSMRDNPPSDWCYNPKFLVENIDNVLEFLQ